MTRFIRSLLRSKKPQPQYVKIWYFTDERSEYDRARAAKEKIQAFHTTFPEGHSIYTVELMEEITS